MKDNILFSKAISNLRPNIGFTIDGFDVSTLKFNGSVKKLTEKEILQEYDVLKSEYDSNEYKRKRQQEYPDFLEYLDAVVKGDTEQMQLYIDKCLAVKEKYPKPE